MRIRVTKLGLLAPPTQVVEEDRTTRIRVDGKADEGEPGVWHRLRQWWRKGPIMLASAQVVAEGELVQLLGWEDGRLLYNPFPPFAEAVSEGRPLCVVLPKDPFGMCPLWYTSPIQQVITNKSWVPIRIETQCSVYGLSFPGEVEPPRLPH